MESLRTLKVQDDATLFECIQHMNSNENFQDFIMSMLKRKFFPKCVQNLSESRIKEKTKKLYELKDLYDDDRTIKITFFMIVFKFAYSRRTKFSNGWKNCEEDPNYMVYEQASEALWGYLESLPYELVRCGKNEEIRIRCTEPGEEWIRWVRSQGDRFVKFLNFVQKKPKYKGTKLFSYFILEYLNPEGRPAKKLKK